MSKECIAMLLAGRQGSRLGALTQKIAKPAVSFGGKFRIIDFSLSNCSNSGIDTVGVLTQYRPYLSCLCGLWRGMGSGQPRRRRFDSAAVRDADRRRMVCGHGRRHYAEPRLYQGQRPQVRSDSLGDHLYRMDYRKMLKTHIENNADLTVSVMPVPWRRPAALAS